MAATGYEDSDGYYGASRGTAYNNPYGNQEPAVNQMITLKHTTKRWVRTCARVGGR